MRPMLSFDAVLGSTLSDFLPMFASHLRRAAVSVEPITAEQALLAREAFSDYGKGRHHAGLNFGDCFSRVLAKATAEPLLFRGGGFCKPENILTSWF